MMPAGDMPYTPPRCPLGVVVFAFQRHRMNRRDRRPNPRFLTTATQGEVPSVDVRLVWELRVLRGAHARRKRSRRYSLKPSANGFLEWVPIPVHKAGMRTGHSQPTTGSRPSSALCPLCPHRTCTHRLLPNRKYEIGPMKLTKDTAVHRRLSPLISSSGRLQMSAKAAISSATWIVPESMMPRRCLLLSSLQRLFAMALLLRKFLVSRVG